MLPGVIVIGAMKCATTSLHYYLDLHPDIAMAPEKELHFFVAERNWSRGLAWYEGQFAGGAALHGESSTSYSRFPEYAGVPARMHSVVPGARLIYIVRDPIERIVSHYVHEYAAGREQRSLPEALADLEKNPYLDTSRYGLQLEQYLEFYPRERILVLTAEDLRARRRETIRRAYRFLGVGDRVHDPRFALLKHRSRDKRRLRPAGAKLAWMTETAFARRLRPAVRRSAWRMLSYPFSSRVETPALEPDLRRRLEDALGSDAERFERLTGAAWPARGR